VLTIHRLSAGDGYRYLLRHTAAGDIDRAPGTALTAYYTTAGYPAGRWIGTGLNGLAGELRPGDQVTEEQMANLYGRGLDPVGATPLGRPYPTYRPLQDRINERIGRLPDGLATDDRAARIARIEAEEKRRRVPVAVAGFDLTFSPVKSVSALWAIADHATQQQIVAAHHEALADVVALMEREVVFTRVGAGGVAQLDTRGVVAAAFDHWDTRSGDPQLHTHLVVANRVQGHDGKWRTLDGRPLYAATVALSETYNDLLADKLTARLGVGWEHRHRGPNRNPAWEISGVPQALLEEFSARTQQIEAHLVDLVREHTERTGHRPGRRDMYALRQRATLLDRPSKQSPRPLPELTAGWRERARRVLGEDPAILLHEVVDRSRHTPLTAAEVGAEVIEGYAVTVLLAVQTQRSTWTRWNLYAEAARQTREVRMASTDDRIGLLEQVVDLAVERSVPLAAPEFVEVPDRFRRASGESVFTEHYADRYTSVGILGAEAYLLDQAATSDAPIADSPPVDKATVATDDGGSLGADQAAAVGRIATSGQRVEVLLGPAGAGKTATMRALRAAWEAQHGAGSVVGLAPFAAGAEVLGDALGIPTENVAKWLHEAIGTGARRRTGSLDKWHALHEEARHAGRTRIQATAAERLTALQAENQRWRLRNGQLVILDEASLASTLQLAAVARLVEAAGAKLLLVGDDAQLASVDACGAFRLLARDTHAAELTEIRRFRNNWERAASLKLRHGDPQAITRYADQNRIAEGGDADMQQAAYHAWRADVRAGKQSLLIASDNATVAALNTRARLDRIGHGAVESGGVRLHDSTEAGVGDHVVTRLNARKLTDSAGRFVRNGDTWTVTKRWRDGSLTVARPSGKAVTLPAGYVAASVELAYAATAHRAQGRTVDTGHVIARAGMTRETLYVGITRGRDANHAYVVTDAGMCEEHQRQAPSTGRDVLVRILANPGAEPSATEVMRHELNAASSPARRAAIQEHIAQTDALDRWQSGLVDAGLPAQLVPALVTSAAWPALVADLRRAESMGLNAGDLLSTAVHRASFVHAKDIASVLHKRFNAELARTAPGTPGQHCLTSKHIGRSAGPSIST
jgi:conjugative relaxase-like TrwC/TraI family protein